MDWIFRAVVDMQNEGSAGALCTIVQTSGSTPRHQGSKMLIYEDGRAIGTVGGGEVESRVRDEALGAIRDGKTRVLNYKMVNPKEGDPGVCGGALEVFVEPILPKPTIVIIGGGHVGKALAYLAHWLEFKVAVSDDRVEFCNKEYHPEADEFYPIKMSELPTQLKITPRSYLLLMTRGSAIDVEGLPELLKTPAAYIGIIGSKRRWVTTRKALIENGISEADLNRVHSPIGLELNAETPEEIAVSIMAEIIMLRNGGSGKLMKM